MAIKGVRFEWRELKQPDAMESVGYENVGAQLTE